LDSNKVETQWPDFEVRRYGDVILCVGEDSVIWPSDATLLSNLAILKPIEAPSAAREYESNWSAPKFLMNNGMVMVGVSILLIPILMIVFGSESIQAEPRPETNLMAKSLLSKIKQKLESEKFRGLDVKNEQGRMFVEGVVEDAAEDTRARSALMAYDRSVVVMSWSTASQISDSITSALNEPNIKVEYVGDGNFVVEGIASSPDQIRVKASKLKNDFSSGVRSIEVRVQNKNNPQAKASAMLESGSLSYVVRPDGGKTFTTTTY
jgi:type III secretion protein D